MKTASIFHTRPFDLATEYVAEHRATDPSLDWDSVDGKGWLQLAKVLEIDIEAMAGGKARRAIDNAFDFINSTSKTLQPISTVVPSTVTNADVLAKVEEQKAEIKREEEEKANIEAMREKKRLELLESAKKNQGVKTPEPKPEPVKKAEPSPTPAPAPVVPINEGSDEAQLLALLGKLAGKNNKVEINEESVKHIAERAIMDAATLIKEDITESVGMALSNVGESLKSYVDEEMVGAFRSFQSIVSEITSKSITVIRPNTEPVKVGKTHFLFERVLKAVSARVHLYLVGPAGSGKTHLCEQVAEGLGLEFRALSVCAQSSKTDLLGYQNITNGEYITTGFREAYEKGGVYCLDEIDNGNANVIAVLNSSLANGKCAFPDGMIKMHDDFVLIACANTFGLGSDRVYVGRNQLDAATLDRFAMIEFPYDEALELEIAPNKEFTLFVQKVREELKSERVVISPRASIKGGKLLAAGWNIEDVIDSVLRAGLPSSLKGRIDVKGFRG